MNWFECILIVGGISLDIFASMEIEGAMLAEVKRKSLLTACTLVTILQLGFFYGGYFTGSQLNRVGVFQNAHWVGELIAIAVFLMIGVRLIIKAIRREFVDEKRRECTPTQYIRIISVTSIYTLIAGFAAGLLGINVWMMFALIIVCSVLVVVGGLYTGYHFGFQAKTIAYIFGAILLFASGAEMLIKNIILVS